MPVWEFTYFTNIKQCLFLKSAHVWVTLGIILLVCRQKPSGAQPSHSSYYVDPLHTHTHTGAIVRVWLPTEAPCSLSLCLPRWNAAERALCPWSDPSNIPRRCKSVVLCFKHRLPALMQHTDPRSTQTTSSLSDACWTPGQQLLHRMCKRANKGISTLEVKSPEAVTGAAIGHKTHGRPEERKVRKQSERGELRGIHLQI